MRATLHSLAFSIAPLLAATPSLAETFDSSAGPLSVERVAGPFDHPWSLAFLPDGGLLVTERPGRLVLLSEGGERLEVAGAPEVASRGQGGLLDVALSPDFAETGLLFLSFSEPAGGGRNNTAVARAVLQVGAPPELKDVEVIFRQQPSVDSNKHFGSRIVVAGDGSLFVTLGERGQRPMAQKLDNHFGKVVRIAPDGSISEDSPAIDVDGVLPEIWSYGHRNPQGAALEPSTGRLWIVEHGAKGGDELNQPKQGKNYGWPEISYGAHYSGAAFPQGTSAPGMEQPVYYWDPSIAPSGLAFYDGDLFPEWKGDLLVGALKYQLIAHLTVEDGEVTSEERLFEGEFGRIRDVRSGPDGAIWFLTDASDGALYRVTPAK